MSLTMDEVENIFTFIAYFSFSEVMVSDVFLRGKALSLFFFQIGSILYVFWMLILY